MSHILKQHMLHFLSHNNIIELIVKETSATWEQVPALLDSSGKDGASLTSKNN